MPPKPTENAAGITEGEQLRSLSGIVVPAELRRTPKISIFLTLGVLSGVIGSLLVLLLVRGFADASPVGFFTLSLFLIGAGIAVFTGISLLLERITRRSQRRVWVECQPEQLLSAPETPVEQQREQ